MRTTSILGYASIFLSAVLYWLGFSMIRPVMSLYFSDHGFRAGTIGIFMALNSILPIALAMPIGSWIDKIGVRKSVWLGSAISLMSGASFWVGGSESWLWLVLFGQVINGIGGLLSWSSLQAAASLSASKHEDKDRGRRSLSNFTFVNSLAQLLGPSLGGYLSDGGGEGNYSLVFAAFTIMNVVALLMTAFLPRANNQSAARPIRERQGGWQREFLRSYGAGYFMMRRNKPFAAAIILNGILFMLVDLRTTFFPLYLDSLAITHTLIGTVLSVSALATLIVRPFTAFAIKQLGQYRIMMTSMVLAGICLVLLALRPGIAVLAMIMFLWGASTGINQPLAMIMVSQNVEPQEQGMGMSIRTMSNRVVQLTNPLFFGAVTTLIGLAPGFAAMGVMLLGAGAVYRRQNRRERARVRQGVPPDIRA